MPWLPRSFFLPPTILYAGLSCRKKAFFSNLPTIASLGILGTYIAFAVIALTLYGFSRLLNITLAVSPTCPLHCHMHTCTPSRTVSGGHCCRRYKPVLDLAMLPRRT